MDNYEVTGSTVGRAERCMREAEQAFKEGDWNLTIRRVQEGVELMMKAILRFVGVEVPKMHDVADIVIKKLEEKGVEVGEDKERVKEISHVLSKMRAPAFYGEVVYGEEEAKRVMQEGKWVMVRLRRWLEEVGWRGG
mgnify:CR=1 FL=1